MTLEGIRMLARPFAVTMWRLIVTALCSGSGLGSFMSVAHADVLDQIRERKHMVIAHRESSFPFSFVDASGNVRGYAIDLCMNVVEAVRKELKLAALPVKFMMVTPATRMTAITSGSAELECGSTTNNAERRKLVDYTIPHFISGARLIVRAGRGLNDIDDLRDKSVVSTKGTTNITTLRRLSAERNLNLKVSEVADHAEGFRAVESGTADAFAMDDVLLFGLRARSANPKNFEVIGKPMSLEPYAIMLPKSQPRFQKIVDNEMRRLILDGQINSIYKKWFESPVPPEGINMELKMPFVLRDSFRVPMVRVNDWYLD
jgi:ABC-type amino acid transport substrate-binding protein